MLSRTSEAPFSLAAAEQMIGTSEPRAVAAWSAVRTSSSVSSVPSRYFSSRASSLSAAASTSAACARSISALISAGNSCVRRASSPVELVGAIVDEVDVATEPVRRPDRHGDGDRLAVEHLAERVDGGLVRRVLLVHAVHDDERGNAGGLDHLPGHLCADLHAAGRRDDEHRRIRDRKRLDNLSCKVLEAGRVDEVDPVPVPVAVGDRESDAHRVALLFGLEVEERGGKLGRPHALRRSCGVEQRLTEGRLAVVAVPDDGDGSNAIRRSAW